MISCAFAHDEDSTVEAFVELFTSKAETTPEVHDTNSTVEAFVELLTRKSEPTADEYSLFVGGGGCGGEFELDFNVQECEALGHKWGSQECMQIVSKDCTRDPSRHLNWIRDQFSTKSATYRLLKSTKIASNNGEPSYELINVEIGNHTFLLFYSEHTPYTVAISKVDNIDISVWEDRYFDTISARNKTVKNKSGDRVE